MAYLTSNSGYLFQIDLLKGQIANKRLLKGSGQGNKLSMPSPVVIQTQSKSFVVSSCEDTKVCLLDSNLHRIVDKVDVGGFVSGSFHIWQNSIYLLVNNRGLVQIN